MEHRQGVRAVASAEYASILAEAEPVPPQDLVYPAWGSGRVHANPHPFRHTFATWTIENHARKLDVQYLLGQSTSAIVRRYSATYDAAKAAAAHASFSPAARLLRNGAIGS